MNLKSSFLAFKPMVTLCSPVFDRIHCQETKESEEDFLTEFQANLKPDDTIGAFMKIYDILALEIGFLQKMKTKFN
jgi:hypothetical protein